MSRKYFTLALLLLNGLILFAQDFINQSANDHITFSVVKQFHNNHEKNMGQYTFDMEGKIKQIVSSSFYFETNTNKKYTAKYFYSNDGKLDKEILYNNIDGHEIRHVSQYNYDDKCTSVTVTQNDQKVIGQLSKCMEDESLIQTNTIDRVLSNKHFHLDNKKITRHYNDNSLSKLEILRPIPSKTNNGIASFVKETYDIKHDDKWTIISYKSELTNAEKEEYQDYTQSEQYRFFDKEQRLIAIGTDKNPKNWTVKFQYNKLGFIKKITERDKKKGSNQEVKHTTLIDTDISKSLQKKIKANKTTIKTINEELLSILFPITGKGRVIDYLDSRRFIGN